MAQKRKDMIFKFGRKAAQSEKFSNWFVKTQINDTTRRPKAKPVYKSVTCRTTRYERSPLPVLTKTVSWHPPKIYIAPQVYQIFKVDIYKSRVLSTPVVDYSEGDYLHKILLDNPWNCM